MPSTGGVHISLSKRDSEKYFFKIEIGQNNGSDGLINCNPAVSLGFLGVVVFYCLKIKDMSVQGRSAFVGLVHI